MTPAQLEALADNPELMEVGRRAIEDTLIDLRDARIGLLGRRNGLVVREVDGQESNIIRLGPEMAVSVALKAIAAHLSKG